MNPSASELLEDQLALFTTMFPREGLNLRAIVNSSPEIRTGLLQVIERGDLSGGIYDVNRYDAEIGVLGVYSQRSRSMLLNLEILQKSDSDSSYANAIRFTIGHEIAHAISSKNIEAADENFAKQIDAIVKGDPPHDVTSAFEKALAFQRHEESRAEISGLNTLAAHIKRENPQASEATLFNALYNSTQLAQNYFDVQGNSAEIVYTPKPGISFNKDFQIEHTQENIDAFGKYFFDHEKYPINETHKLIDSITAFKGPPSTWQAQKSSGELRDIHINLEALGVDANQIELPPGFTDISNRGPKQTKQATEKPEISKSQEEDNDHVHTWSSSHASALSPVSNQLLQSGELWLRQVADQRGLPWGQGMQNTVAAMASKAREAGLTDITHLRVAPNDIHMAQFDGHTIREAHLNAHQAANTQQEQSREQLAQKDREAEHSEATARTADAPSHGALQAHAAPVRSM